MKLVGAIAMVLALVGCGSAVEQEPSEGPALEPTTCVSDAECNDSDPCSPLSECDPSNQYADDMGCTEIQLIKDQEACIASK